MAPNSRVSLLDYIVMGNHVDSQFAIDIVRLMTVAAEGEGVHRVAALQCRSVIPEKDLAGAICQIDGVRLPLAKVRCCFAGRGGSDMRRWQSRRCLVLAPVVLRWAVYCALHRWVVYCALHRARTWRSHERRGGMEGGVVRRGCGEGL
jgi:hypothetical protein